MQEKFEYKILTFTNYGNAIEKELNKLGLQGWELVSINSPEYYFKRKINEAKMIMS